MQVLGQGRAIMRWLPIAAAPRITGNGAARARKPVAVVIGADPATILAAVMPAPESLSASCLCRPAARRRPDLAACLTVPLRCRPARRS